MKLIEMVEQLNISHKVISIQVAIKRENEFDDQIISTIIQKCRNICQIRISEHTNSIDNQLHN